MDKKLTDSEIPNVKELLEYKVKAHCELCDLKHLDCCNTCIYTTIKQFIELFNRLQAERDTWKETAETSEKAYEEWHRVAELNAMKIIELQAENEVLEARIGVYETCNARKDEAIRGLEAENERLKKTVDIHKGIAEDWKHEAKKLQMVIDEVDDYIHPLPFETDYDKAIKQAKAEAYKEFAERFVTALVDTYDLKSIQIENIEKIKNNLLKELVGEDNGKEKE